jgi:hypothetical protein
MATAQPASEARLAPDIRFRSARTKVLWISLVLGTFVLFVVPIHSAFVADPRILTDERYVLAACNWPFPLAPGSVCPRVFAGESPFMVLYALVVVPLLLIRGGAKTMLTIGVLSLVFALVQIAAAFRVLSSRVEPRSPSFRVRARSRHLRAGALRSGPFLIPLCSSAFSADPGLLWLPGLPDDARGE